MENYNLRPCQRAQLTKIRGPLCSNWGRGHCALGKPGKEIPETVRVVVVPWSLSLSDS